MLKTIRFLDVSELEEENGNDELVRFGFDNSSKKFAKKLGKKSSKSRNSFHFDTKENDLSFLTPKARVTFNYLWLAYTKAPIL